MNPRTAPAGSDASLGVASRSWRRRVRSAAPSDGSGRRPPTRPGCCQGADRLRRVRGASRPAWPMPERQGAPRHGHAPSAFPAPRDVKHALSSRPVSRKTLRLLRGATRLGSALDIPEPQRQVPLRSCQPCENSACRGRALRRSQVLAGALPSTAHGLTSGRCCVMTCGDQRDPARHHDARRGLGRVLSLIPPARMDRVVLGGI